MSLLHRSAPASNAPSLDEALSSDKREMFARLVTGTAMAMVLVMVSFICYRWEKVHEPTATLMVVGDESLDGATVEAVPQDDPAMVQAMRNRGSIAKEKLTRENRWQTPILLDPGIYRLHVTRHGNPIQLPNSVFSLERLDVITCELPSLVTLIGGPMLADAKVEISHVPARDSVPPALLKLPGQDRRYRTDVLLLPGSYEARVFSPTGVERVIAEVDFVVDRTHAVQLDLLRAVNEWPMP